MSEAHRVVHLVRRAPRADVVILAITFTLTVFADLVVAVNIGIILAIFQFLRRMAASVTVTPVGLSSLPDVAAQDGPNTVRALRVQGPLFFAAIETLRTALETHRAPVVVLCLEQVPFADATALQLIDDQIVAAHAAGTRIVLCGLNGRIQAKLGRMGTLARLGSGERQPDLATALAVHGMQVATGGAKHPQPPEGPQPAQPSAATRKTVAARV